MADVEARVALARLMDFYAPLLTEHRREVMRLYCDEDLSLAEIAQQMEITRQGVSDALNKARGTLEDYEDKLGLVRRDEERSALALRALEALGKPELGETDIELARRALRQIISER